MSKMKVPVLSTTALLLLGLLVHISSQQPFGLLDMTLAVVNNSSNVTNIIPGDAICAETTLQPPLKQKRIFIGVVGCNVDPLLVSLQDEDIPVEVLEDSNCHPEVSENETCPFPGA